ncbi:Amastin surface glycoprotein [Novymonas esmeraldas]|uniref:Amastin surface glycoprotein n=1 Tax=Novymonas esmeraldas TaxID=1808958 RepID=A0AAW0EZZ3_9TRYP
MRYVTSFISAVLFTVVQCVVVVLVVVATPISQIDSTRTKGCHTFWGYKADCTKTKYTQQGKAAFFNCAMRRNNMNGGAALAIISIVTTLVTLLFCVFMLLRVSCPVLLPFIFACVSVITTLISWACVAGAYSIKMCDWKWSDGVLGSLYKYGPGFWVMIAATCLQFVNAVGLGIISFV